MTTVVWEYVPDDIIEALLTILYKPLRDGDKKTPSQFDQSVYAYFNLLQTSKRFHSMSKLLDVKFDWFMLSNQSPYDKDLQNIMKEGGALAEEPKRIMKTLTFCHSALPLIRSQIDSFMNTHNIIYRTRGSNKVYKGFVGIRKLKAMKIHPKELDTEFKTLCKRHEAVNKKKNAVRNALRTYSSDLYAKRRKGEVANVWCGYLTA